MSHYVIGDVQGCDRSLAALLRRIAFHPERDRLWLVGDLVNRGPASLEVLRRVRDLGPAATTVLGNHDLYLLARFAGLPPKDRDTLEPVLKAPDGPALCDWLRTLPLAVYDGTHLMIHAGLMPTWTLAETLARARAAELRLQGPDWGRFVHGLRPHQGPDHETVAVLTRLRMLTDDGEPEWRYKAPPEHAPMDLTPWYLHSALLQHHEARVLFGHWAALGFRQLPSAVAMDTGCAWGKHLTAMRLEDNALFAVPLLDVVEGGQG